MSCNSKEGEEQSRKSEKILFYILKQNTLKRHNPRLSTKDEDERLHYDLSWFDIELGHIVYADVKTVMPERRGTGNYSVSYETYDYVFGRPECLMNCYYWALELYDESGEPTGEFRILNCLTLSRIGNEVMTDNGGYWLLRLDDALRLIPESPHDNFVISSDIPV